MENEPSKKPAFGWPFWLLIAVIFLFAVGAIVVPNFVKARNTSAQKACIANLKQIDGAVQQWALENKKTATDTYSLIDPNVLAYLKGSVLPDCPAGGRYRPGKNIGANPLCTIGGPGHTL